MRVAITSAPFLSIKHTEQTLVPCLPHVIHVRAKFTIPGEWLGHLRLEYRQANSIDSFQTVLVPVYAKCITHALPDLGLEEGLAP